MKRLVSLFGFALGFTIASLGMRVITHAAQAPTISFTAPPDGATVAGSISLGVTTSATAACVQYSVDSQVLGITQATPFDWTWDSKSISDGPHTLKAIAEDSTGVDSIPATRAITVANGVIVVIPTLTVSAITSGNSGNYTINVKLSQTLSGLPATIIVTWPTGITKTITSTITSGLATTQIKLKGQPRGIYTVQAITLVNGTTVNGTITFRY